MSFRLWLALFFLSIQALTIKVNAADLKESAAKSYLDGLQALATPNLKETDYEHVLSHFEKAKAEAATNKDEADLYHLSILGLARVYYEMAYGLDASDTRRSIFLNRSIAEYRSIPRFSLRWSEALFEQAWAYAIMDDDDGALGALYSLKDPYFSLGFFPELNVLEAIIYWRNCHFEKAWQALQTFQSSYASLLPALKELMQKNMDDQSWFRLLEEPSELPEKVRNYLRQEKQYQSMQSIKKFLEVSSYLDQSEKELQKKVGTWVKDNVHRIIYEIEAMQIRAQIISLETKSAEASLLEQERPILPPIKKASSRSYVVGPDYFFWGVSPKERWIDELGYYRIAVKSLCYE